MIEPFYEELITKRLERDHPFVYDLPCRMGVMECRAAEWVRSDSYLALCEIKKIIEDVTLTDFDCVEQIVAIFEDIGSDGGSRHDFG